MAGCVLGLGRPMLRIWIRMNLPDVGAAIDRRDGDRT